MESKVHQKLWFQCNKYCSFWNQFKIVVFQPAEIAPWKLKSPSKFRKSQNRSPLEGAISPTLKTTDLQDYKITKKTQSEWFVNEHNRLLTHTQQAIQHHTTALR